MVFPLFMELSRKSRSFAVELIRGTMSSKRMEHIFLEHETELTVTGATYLLVDIFHSHSVAQISRQKK